MTAIWAAPKFGGFGKFKFVLRLTALAVTPIGVGGASGLRCPTCGEVFCAHCDELIHDTLHTCPGCAARPSGPRP